MKTALFSVFHEGVKQYSLDFIESLNSQTDMDYEVILLNDSKQSIEETLRPLKVKSHIIKEKDTIPKNRETGINFAKKHGYDYLIFLDFDDIMDLNRVEIVKKLLKYNDIVINQITTLQAPHKPLLNIEKHSCLQEKNYCGFCNSAVNLTKIPLVSFHDNLIAVDWYFFTMLKNLNFSFIFTEETITRYRQHIDNTIGIKKKYTKGR